MTGPSRRERMKPVELVGLAGIVLIFVGVVVLATTRDLPLAAIFAGIAFILTLLLLAMLSLVGTSEDPDPEQGPVLEQPRRRRRGRRN
jgi:hypothetical protein